MLKESLKVKNSDCKPWLDETRLFELSYIRIIYMKAIRFVRNLLKINKNICGDIWIWILGKLFSRQNERRCEENLEGHFWLYMGWEGAVRGRFRGPCHGIYAFRPSIWGRRKGQRLSGKNTNLLRRTYYGIEYDEPYWFEKSGRRKFSRHSAPITSGMFSKWIKSDYIKKNKRIQGMLGEDKPDTL